MAIILLACGPCVVIVDYWDRLCTLGRAPRTKETLPDFRQWCRVTRHLRVICGLTGCQRALGFGASQYEVLISMQLHLVLISIQMVNEILRSIEHLYLRHPELCWKGEV